MFHGKRVAIVTRLMNRLNVLHHVIPTWLSIPQVDSIIIVDWGCKEDTGLIRYEYPDERIRIIKVPDKSFFDSGASWNEGIRNALCKYVFTVDCDILIKKNPFLAINPEKLRRHFYGWAELPSLTGTSIYPKRMWQDIGGYHEGFPTYGGEDVDFFERAKGRGYRKIEFFTKEYLQHVPHDNLSRMKNFPAYGSHPDFSLKQSIAFNKEWVASGH
jgi:predicted glycosyltransferase involved in capsule biosynthesis